MHFDLSVKVKKPHKHVHSLKLYDIPPGHLHLQFPPGLFVSEQTSLCLQRASLKEKLNAFNFIIQPLPHLEKYLLQFVHEGILNSQVG